MEEKNSHKIHAIFHCTGGGQTKCLHYGKGFHYVKNNFFKMPKLFEMIQNSSKVDWKEMFHVFNMGHRMEIICPETYAAEYVIPQAKKYNIEASIIGNIEKSSDQSINELTINHSTTNFTISL